jgi:hypothetical protein
MNYSDLSIFLSIQAISALSVIFILGTRQDGLLYSIKCECQDNKNKNYKFLIEITTIAILFSILLFYIMNYIQESSYVSKIMISTLIYFGLLNSYLDGRLIGQSYASKSVSINILGNVVKTIGILAILVLNYLTIINLLLVFNIAAIISLYLYVKSGPCLHMNEKKRFILGNYIKSITLIIPIFFLNYDAIVQRFVLDKDGFLSLWGSLVFYKIFLAINFTILPLHIMIFRRLNKTISAKKAISSILRIQLLISVLLYFFYLAINFLPYSYIIGEQFTINFRTHLLVGISLIYLPLSYIIYSLLYRKVRLRGIILNLMIVFGSFLVIVYRFNVVGEIKMILLLFVISIIFSVYSFMLYFRTSQESLINED